MVAKILFLVLLGAALAFASPIPAEDEHNSTPATVETIVNEVVSEDAKDINVVNVSVIDQPLETVTEKHRILRFFKKSTRFLKEAGPKLIKKGKEVFEGGKELLKQVTHIAKEVKRVLKEIRDQITSKEVKEMVNSIKRLFIEVKDTGSEAFDELKSIIKDVEDIIKHQEEPTDNEKKLIEYVMEQNSQNNP